MSELRIRCRLDGPLVIEGPVIIVDHLGNPFPIRTDKPTVALCRCGQSQNKPFCDGTHKKVGFKADQTAPAAAAPLPGATAASESSRAATQSSATTGTPAGPSAGSSPGGPSGGSPSGT
jgi:CDGSH-type Zn-finger protein